MTTLILGLLIPLLGTMLGSAFVFFMKKDMSPRLQKSLLGFASGVMVAASIWSLLIPSMEMVADSGRWSVLPAAVGFLLGCAVFGHHHLNRTLHQAFQRQGADLCQMGQLSHVQFHRKSRARGSRFLPKLQALGIIDVQAHVRPQRCL